VDLLVRWRYPEDASRENQREQRIALELKTIRSSSHNSNKVIPEGLEQTARYAQQSNAAEAHLIVCDQRDGCKWDKKIYDRIQLSNNREIHIWGV
jgi:hypothetical protein